MKYRLKKDLPGYKAGTTFVQDPYWTYLSEDGDTKTSCTDIAGTLNRAPYEPDWFEPLPEAPTRWRAKEGETYFFVNPKIEVAQTTEEHGSYDDTTFDRGNYFKNKETTEAVATAIKSLLEYVHEPLDENGYNKKSLEMSKKAAIACQVVQTSHENNT